MATSYGFSRNMDHNMTDKQYRNIARITVSDQEHYINAFSRFTHGNIIRRNIWLRLMGLIETRVMKNE